MPVSKKKVIELHELLDQRMFTLPRNMANEIDLKTGEPCLFIGVNGKKTYIPVEKPTPISHQVFCVLKDIGILDKYEKYEEGDLFT